MKVKFTQDRVVLDGLEGTDEETRFEAGKVYDLPVTSADRWIQRGIAVLVDDGASEESEEPGAESGEITHVGGGYYELPDGRRVRGKDAALAALGE